MLKEMNVYNIRYEVECNKDIFGITGTETKKKSVMVVADTFENAVKKASSMENKVIEVSLGVKVYV